MKVYVNNHNGVPIVVWLLLIIFNSSELIPGLEDTTKTPRVISYHVNSY